MHIKNALTYTLYPSLMITAVFLQILMPSFGISSAVGAYLVVLSAACIITLFERHMPARQNWKPFISEVKQDVLFMVILQVVFARLLSFSVVLLLAAYAFQFTGFWPSDLNIGLQVIFMMLIADFFRYWLHRLAHKKKFLWRFHAVHHSPNKLYWLNTGRFHPVDKGLQFLFDALPFIVLGVNTEVLSLYFVFYAINGFFQHSNIELKFGWLNYVISSAELHRWHHSRDKDESDHNYGNNLIIWDLVFGTYYLPSQKNVTHLGLSNAKYPQSFIDQMLAPFQKNGRL